MERIVLTFSSRDNNSDDLIAIAQGAGIATVYSRTPSLIAQSIASLDVVGCHQRRARHPRPGQQRTHGH